MEIIEVKAAEKDEIIRQKIIDTAKEEFMQYGFHRISMDDIAEKLSMSKKTLYRYFTGKDDLIRTVMMGHMRCFDEISAMISEKRAESEFINKMVEISSKIAELVSRMPIHVMRDLQRNSPDIYDEMQTHKKENISRGFGAFIREGKQAGVFREELPEDIMIKIQLTIIEHMFNPEILMSLPYTPIQYHQHIITFVMQGMFTEKGRMQMKDAQQANNNGI